MPAHRRRPVGGVIAIAAAPERAAAAPDRRRTRIARVALGAALAVTVAPFVRTIAHVLGGATSTSLAGDEALAGLAVDRAGDLAQLLGPYSQWGWYHPGPAWFYLLLPVYGLGGRSGAALVAAQLTVHALSAALVVLAVHSRTAAWRAPLMAACVLAFVARMPEQIWLKVWNPYALVLPVALLVLLTARTVAAPASRTRWWGATVVAASFVVQSHVGTAVVAATCVVVATAALAQPARRGRILAALPWLAVAALAWLPPLIQQAAPPAGEPANVTALADYFLHGDQEGAPLADRLALAGRVLGYFPFGRALGPLAPEVHLASPDVLIALLIPVPVALLVVLVGRRLGERLLPALGLALAAATVAGLASAVLLEGPLLTYVLIWLGAIPMVLLFAVLDLLAAVAADLGRRLPRPAGSRSRVHRTVAVAGTAALLAALVGPASATLRDGERSRPDSVGVQRSADRVLAVLAGIPGCARSPVLVDIGTTDRWPVASGLAFRLERAGHPARVIGNWTLLFGSRAAARGDEPCAVWVTDPAAADGDPLLVVDSDWGPAAVGVERRAP